MKSLSEEELKMKSDPGQKSLEIVQRITIKSEKLDAEKENLVGISKKYLKNKDILMNISKAFRRHQIGIRLMNALKEQTDVFKMDKLKAQLQIKNQKLKTMKKVFCHLKKSIMKKRRESEMNKTKDKIKADIDSTATSYQSAIIQLETILKNKIYELTTKTGKLNQIKLKYAELSN